MREINRRIFSGRRWVCLLGVFALAALTVSADTISSDLSTQVPPFDPGTGDSWAVGTSTNIELAAGFQDPSATVSYLLTQVQVADNFSAADPDASGNAALNDLVVGIWQSTTNDPNSASRDGQSWPVVHSDFRDSDDYQSIGLLFHHRELNSRRRQYGGVGMAGE
jgi:hypothetical protein